LERKNLLNLASVPLELRLILACLRGSGGQEGRNEISALSQRTIDWDALIRLVDRHRVSSTVYRSLNHFAGDAVAEPVLARLRVRFQTNTKQALLKTAELVRILRRFEQRGIPALPLKGPVLALQIHGDLGSRHVGDLDIMIAPTCIEEAEKILLQEGYRRAHPSFVLTPGQGLAYRRTDHHFGYFCHERSIRVELHWRSVSNRYLFPIKFNDMWKEREIAKIAGGDVATLSLEHTILYLCVHGGIHAWFRLFWLNDLAQLLCRYQAIEWDSLMDRAARLGVRRVTAEGLILSNILLNSPLPDPFSVYADKDKGVYGLVRISIYLIKHPGGESYRPFTLAYVRKKMCGFRLRNDLQYRLAFLFNQIGVASGDWESVSLPDSLFPLYYFLRPFMWFFRWYVRNVRVYRSGPMGDPKNDTKG
jgi:hypothetical protein